MHYTVDGGAEKPKKGREATRRLATAGDHSLPPLGLERQRREMFFFWSPGARDTQKKLEPHQACLVGAGATEERQPLLKVLPRAGGLGRVVRNIMASPLLLLSSLLPASLFG